MLHWLLARRTSKHPPRLTPDTAQAEALRRKLAALDYTPSTGFLKDHKQPRIRPMVRRYQS
jgi:hypothetical protein